MVPVTARKKKKTAWGMWMRMGWHQGPETGQGRAAGGGIEVSGLGLRWANMQPNSSLF